MVFWVVALQLTLPERSINRFTNQQLSSAITSRPTKFLERRYLDQHSEFFILQQPCVVQTISQLATLPRDDVYANAGCNRYGDECDQRFDSNDSSSKTSSRRCLPCSYFFPVRHTEITTWHIHVETFSEHPPARLVVSRWLPRSKTLASSMR